jgi:hypothetical protein
LVSFGCISYDEIVTVEGLLPSMASKVPRILLGSRSKESYSVGNPGKIVEQKAIIRTKNKIRGIANRT